MIGSRYDGVPYPSQPFHYTHPDHLAVVATLLGLSPALADGCRVRELDCASGGNLVPLAYNRVLRAVGGQGTALPGRG